jgi:hypothetical protein
MMCLRWLSTVLTLSASASATCRLVRPEEIMASTWRSAALDLRHAHAAGNCDAAGRRRSGAAHAGDVGAERWKRSARTAGIGSGAYQLSADVVVIRLRMEIKTQPLATGAATGHQRPRPNQTRTLALSNPDTPSRTGRVDWVENGLHVSRRPGAGLQSEPPKWRAETSCDFGAMASAW